MPAAAGLSFLLLTAAVDLQVGATLEARQGEAPLVPDLPSEPATVSAVTPLAALTAAARDGTLRLSYNPRLSWVLVRGKGDAKPFVLHNADLAGTFVLQRGVTLGARANVNTGDTDYAALTQVLGRSQRQLPDVTGITYLTFGVGAAVAVAHDWKLDTTLELLHHETKVKPATPVDPNAPPPMTPTGFPSDTSLTLVPDLLYTLGRHDTLDVRGGLSYIWVTTNLKIVTFSPVAGWRHIFGRGDSFRVGGGFAYANELSLPAENGTTVTGIDPAVLAVDNPRTSVRPIGDLGLTLEIGRTRAAIVSTTVGGAVNWYFDPILARPGTVGVASFSLGATFPPKWTASLDAYFATSLQSQPLCGPPVAGMTRPSNCLDETVVAASLPIRYRIGRNVALEFGGRWSDRAPHLKIKPVRFHQRELWIYGAVTGTIGTGRGG